MLLLDEPTAALAPAATAAVEAILRRLAGGAAALLVSHGAEHVNGAEQVTRVAARTHPIAGGRAE